MVAGIYYRISLDRLGEGLGIERQREDGLALAARRGWSVREFSDNDISATHGKFRPGYAALMAAAKAGEIDCIIVFHTSRLWRNRRERAEGIELLKEARVSVVPVKGPELDMTTAYGRGMAGMIGEFDTMEVEVKAERQRREALQRAQSGRPNGGRRAFGYSADGTGLRTEADGSSPEADAVRTAYRSFLAGRTLSGIALDLNEDGFTTTTGGPWRHNAVRVMLLNPRNAGIRTHNGKEVGKAVWPPIVPESTFRATVAKLLEPSRKTNHIGAARKWLGTRLYRCGRTGCEGLMVSTYREKYADGRARRIYRCQICYLSRLAEPVDSTVRRIVEERLGREDVADLLMDDSNASSIAAEDLQGQAVALRQRRDSAVKMWARGVLDDQELETAKQEIADQLAEIQVKMADAGRENALVPILGAEDPPAEWRKLEGNVDREQAIIQALGVVRLVPPPIGRRKFDPETVDLKWHRALH
ncbi:serine recombinase [Actinoplanes capillaceus]|uniref:Serine recombinase n=1 Tax=Actinoplanes campanulatus TaxID=113559 RepID=A0ABQ3WL16_9ACTN|nr:recombinase family protein [Actinoplanes capillaceus]GID46943.1 serine recombinase [Actinoplanes capillaceus]